MPTELPAEVVEADHRLEKATDSASEKLARHRWHWTLDESNPGRVSLRAYARAIGRQFATVRGYAEGYRTFADPGTRISLSEAIERARLSQERETLVEAVADANQVEFTTARRQYGSDVARVREAVEREVERRPAMTTEERADTARQVAKNFARSRAADAQWKEDQKRRRTGRYIELDASLTKVKRLLTDSIQTARDVEFDTDEVELLEVALESVRSVLALLHAAIAGRANVDWDAEMQRLTQ
jgi:hypothetical protein